MQRAKRKTSKKPEDAKRAKITLENIAFWAASYPFECAQTLMKIGYEPIPPKPEKYLGETYLALPNAFSYVKYMISVDGIMGCFRGFTSTMCQKITTQLVTNHLNTNYQPNWDQDCPPGTSRLSLLSLRLNKSCKLPPDVIDILRMAGWRMFTISISTIMSHPFYVLSVRMVAQFVGTETNYATLDKSFRAILREDGILGFFKGLIPRLISENLKILIPSTVFLLVTRVFTNQLVVNGTSSITQFLTDRFAHQFDVVASTMVIQNSSMAIGRFPFLRRKYSSWMNCWAQLSCLRLQNRGRSSFFRYYNGPTELINGELHPKIIYLGPYYRPQLKNIPRRK